MPSEPSPTSLDDIRALLMSQTVLLQKIRDGQTVEKQSHKPHWWRMLVLAFFALSLGVYATYQYYIVLRSVIDQLP